MKKTASSILVLLAIVALVIASPAYAKHGPKREKGPGWVYKGVTIEHQAEGVNHYKWELARPPYGPFDKIALHRYVYEPHNTSGLPGRPAKDKRKVLFMIPGTWDSGSSKGSDPRFSENYFFAANGYDTYSMDFRTSYIANLAYDQFESQGYEDALYDTSDWTYAVFREDIKTCVDMAKKLSRARKLFLAGRSRGGTQMYIYAAKYWKKDLKGLIGLDGGGIYLAAEYPALQRTEAQFETAVQAFKDGLYPGFGKFLSEVSGFEQSRFAGVVPFARTTIGGPLPAPDDVTIPEFAPADKSQIETVSDLVAYGAYYSWGAGLVTNYYLPYPGGEGETYMDRKVLVDIESNFTRYWPTIQDLEGYFLAGYSDCPFLDYDDTTGIDIPVIFFGSELGCNDGSCLSSVQPYKVASDDVTIVYLENYGHLDVYSGTHSLEDVKQPMLDWMNARK